MDVPELAVLAGFAEIVGKAVISHVRLPVKIQGVDALILVIIPVLSQIFPDEFFDIQDLMKDREPVA